MTVPSNSPNSTDFIDGYLLISQLFQSTKTMQQSLTVLHSGVEFDGSVHIEEETEDGQLDVEDESRK